MRACVCGVRKRVLMCGGYARVQVGQVRELSAEMLLATIHQVTQGPEIFKGLLRVVVGPLWIALKRWLVWE